MKKHRFFGSDFAEHPRCKKLRVGAKGVCFAHDQARVSKVTLQMEYYAKVSSGVYSLADWLKGVTGDLCIKSSER